MSLRKIASLVAGSALVVGLLGTSGVGASFLDQATAQMDVQVGTFGCTVDSTTPGAVVSVDLHSVTYSAPEILASAAGSLPFAFTVTSTGDVPVLIHLTQTTPVAPFTSLLAAPADVTLAAFASTTYAGGLQWPELGMADLGALASITYTANCGEVPAGPTPLGSNYVTTQRATDPATGSVYQKVFLCDYVGTPLAFTKVEAMGTGTNAWPGLTIQWPAGNKVGSKAYVLAYNDGQALPPASACPFASSIK
jgi:hypothetical protein